MKKRLIISKNQKRLYLLLIGLAFIAILSGIIFIFLISNSNKIFIKDNLITYFNNLSSSTTIFFKSLFNNFIYIIIIWLFGISIIGIPVVVFMYLFKSFIFGFSISSIIYSFGIKGMFYVLCDLIFNKFIYLVIILLSTFYSLSFSYKLIKYLFLKKSINFRDAMNKYFKILIISLTVSLFITIYEVYILHFLIKIL